MKNKRGQVTIFIIVGIVILVVAGLMIFVTQTDIQIGRRLSTTQVEPIKEYVEDCIQKELDEKLPLMKYWGGYTRLVYGDRNLNDRNYIRNVKGNAEMEEILENSIKERLRNSCSLRRFEENFDLTYDPNVMSVDVKIDDFRVDVLVGYPVIIEKDDLRVGIDQFSAFAESDLGILARAARDYLKEGKCVSNYNLPIEFAIKGVSYNTNNCPDLLLFSTLKEKSETVQEGGQEFRFGFNKNEA